MRTIARAVLFVLVVSVGPGAAPALAQDNTAAAVNTKDGKSVFKLAFSVVKTTGDVDAKNTAVAYANCTDCRTVAAAIQIVLVSEPGDLTPQNEALAINYQCTECETMAVAYQFVFAGGGELTLTKEGKAALHDLKKRFLALQKRDDLSLQQIADEIGVIAAEVAEVLDTELVAKEDRKEGTTTTTTAGPATTTTTGSAPSTTASPTSTTASPSTTTAPSTTTTTTVSVTTTAG